MRSGLTDTSPRIQLPVFIGIFAVILSLASISYIGVMRIQDIFSELDHVVTEQNVRIELMNRIQQFARDRSLNLQTMMIIRDPLEVDSLSMHMSRTVKKYIDAREELLSQNLNSEERDLVEQLNEHAQKTGASIIQATELILKEEYEQAGEVLYNETLPNQKMAIAAMDEFIRLEQSYNSQSVNKAKTEIRATYVWLIGLGVLGALLSVVIAFFVNARINREIVQRLRADMQQRATEQREKLILENMEDAVLTLDEKLEITSYNHATSRMFASNTHELLHCSPAMLLSKPPSTASLGLYLEMEGIRKDGSTFPVNVILTQTLVDFQHIYILVIRDITEKKLAEQELREAQQQLEQRVQERTRELEEMNQRLKAEIRQREQAQGELKIAATRDKLTHLPNRALFTAQLENAVSHAHRNKTYAAVFFLELDGFKAIIDSYGQNVADRLLVAVARRFRSCLRDEDIVARLGGDEFAVIISDLIERRSAEQVAEKLIQSLNHPLLIEGRNCHIGVSIGISYYPQHGEDPDALLRTADDALFAAKRAGKNRYIAG